MGRRRLGGTLQVIVIGVELADQAVELERRLPDVGQEIASGTVAADPSPALRDGVIALVAGATAGEAAGSDLHADRVLSGVI